MKIAVGSDHRGFRVKQRVVNLLRQLGHEVLDAGPEGESSVDYPDFALLVGLAVGHGEVDRGILICGTGIGMTIAANKVPGIRAALCSDIYTARMSREHNDANVLTLGGRLMGPEMALDILKMWLETDFAGDRHRRRIGKIADLERRHTAPDAGHHGLA